MTKVPHPFLSSDKIVLRPLDPQKDAADVMRWINDPEVTQFMFYGQLPSHYEHTTAFLRAMDNPEHTNIVFTVLDAATKKSIGFAGLYEIDWISRRAEFRILIGEKDFWGKGYGTEITQLLTWFGFDRLNLNRIDLGVTSDNKGAITTYTRAGFVYEFTRKQFMYRNSRYYDADFMVLFRDQYYDKFFEEHNKKYGKI
ncbi:MAG: GNAT family protein [bacterium]|nr:GNAT family protein [bacterium]